MPITRVPDLCIEVVSRDRTYDRVTKRLVYAEAGVREMWTVLPAWPLVKRWTGARLERREELRETIESSLLPGFSMNVAALRD
jgi:Uma2 family endonuclease